MSLSLRQNLLSQHVNLLIKIIQSKDSEVANLVKTCLALLETEVISPNNIGVRKLLIDYTINNSLPVEWDLTLDCNKLRVDEIALNSIAQLQKAQESDASEEESSN